MGRYKTYSGEFLEKDHLISLTCDGVFFTDGLSDGGGGGIECFHLYKLVKTIEKA